MFCEISHFCSIAWLCWVKLLCYCTYQISPARDVAMYFGMWLQCTCRIMQHNNSICIKNMINHTMFQWTWSSCCISEPIRLYCLRCCYRPSICYSVYWHVHVLWATNTIWIPPPSPIYVRQLQLIYMTHPQHACTHIHIHTHVNAYTNVPCLHHYTRKQFQEFSDDETEKSSRVKKQDSGRQ